MLTPLEPWIAAKIGCTGRPLTREALRVYQLTALNETLALVQVKSAFYRKSLGEPPVSLTSLEELAQLPLCGADDVRAAPLDFVCVRQDDVERIVTLPTSGTTGPPKRIFFTADDQELTRDFFDHGMSTMVGPGDRVMILLPGSLPGSVGDLLKDGLARMGVAGIPHGPVTEPRQTLAVIEKERVTALVGIPVQVLSLARLASGEPRARASTLHSVLLSTDRTPPAIAQAIAGAWGCKVYDHYGTTEMGLGGGVDCRAGSGYHLREADLLFEIVDPDTGLPVPDGESGEVVFTTLTRRAMPLVRYRTGDVTRFLSEPCTCGTVLKRLAHIEYRLADYLRLPGGGMVRQRNFDELLFPLDELVDFRILFARGSVPATLTVEVKGCEEGSLNRNEVLERLRNMPALSSDVVRGLLSVEVKDWDAGQLNSTGTGKRQIVHIEEGSK